VLKNQSDEVFMRKNNGIPYIWNPGEPMKIPLAIAGRFIGRDKVGLMDNATEKELRKEKRRISESIPLHKRSEPFPLVLVEIIDPNILMAKKKKEFVSEPVLERDEGEKPFASLEPEEEPDLVAKALEKRKPGRPRKEKEPVK
jgi:hypothetical protein